MLMVFFCHVYVLQFCHQLNVQGKCHHGESGLELRLAGKNGHQGEPDGLKVPEIISDHRCGTECASH
jgi:hypothetical protein